jgi:hypothetical protein
MRIVVFVVCASALCAAVLALTDAALLLRAAVLHARLLAPVVALHDAGTLYMASLAARPLSTKCLTALLLFTVADLVAQLMTAPGWPSGWRVLRFALWGALIAAPLLHVWYQFLNQFFSTHFLALGVWSNAIAQSAVDQGVYLPLSICFYYLYNALTTGGTHVDAYIKVCV